MEVVKRSFYFSKAMIYSNLPVSEHIKTISGSFINNIQGPECFSTVIVQFLAVQLQSQI